MGRATVEPRFDVELGGCRPEPLASYLKAIGILRLVGEQRDRRAQGHWNGERFVLRSSLDRAALVRFLLDEWRPTPVVAPWNGGSGFYPKDNKDAPDAIIAADNERLRGFAATIRTAREFVELRGWVVRPEEDEKLLLLSAMRARLPDQALPWLDAAVVLGDDRLLFPPLLGSGGNDGRLDFSNNFQQRVVAVTSASEERPLLASLFGTASASRFEGAMGQYQPAAGERTNPWDFILLIEGALLFAGAATRRLESASPSVMAFPFHARAAGGVGTLAEADEAESRNELWLPLWSAPASLNELRHLFAEGRATVGSGPHARAAASSLDFARALTSLGVDRGISAFARIGFHVRNGKAYYATPLGRFHTREVGSARLLDEIDPWYVRFRQKAGGNNTPAGIRLAHRCLEDALFEAASAGKLGSVLLALGETEQALSRSLSFATKAYLGPVPRLKREWAEAIVDGTVEQRLAAALATRPRMRARLVPLEGPGRFASADESTCVFTTRPLVDNLHDLLRREDIEAQQQSTADRQATAPRTCCSLTDIAAFIDGRTDDVLIERWLRALVLVDSLDLGPKPVDTALPPAAFAVLALVHHRRVADDYLPRTSGVLSRAIAGNAAEATRLAIERLRASGRPLPIGELAEPRARMRRIAAALAFPLAATQRRQLERMVLSKSSDEPEATPANVQLPEETV